MTRPSPPVTRLLAEVERFGAAPFRTTGPGLAIDLPQVQRCIDLIQLRFSEMAAAFAGTDEYDVQGSVSPIHWIRLNCHVGGGAAGDRVAVGEQLGHMPESGEAMAGGEIGFAHLALIARTATALAESGSNKEFDETHLLEKAKRFSVGRFRNFCHHQRHADDPEGYAAEQARGVDARSLTLSSGESGMVWVRGVLDPEGGAALRTALEPLAKRNSKGDDRKLDRRFADALVELAGYSLDNGLVPRRATQRPHLQVTTTLETLLQRAGAPAADLEFSLPISAASVERLACDCNVTRILLGADSQVIDVGRSKRVISPAQRRALNVRDKGCRWPGCDRPASYASGHHLVHWTRGGPTDLDNLALLCLRHHWLAHEGKWQLVKTEGGEIFAVPPQMDLFRQLARGPDAGAA
ncbi:MAG: DUF222 domain-containing protein [Chloroflexi bacterium]|nr:MAG: DUF222 domain-containing protein [Chloroflexota bacterium]